MLQNSLGAHFSGQVFHSIYLPFQMTITTNIELSKVHYFSIFSKCINSVPKVSLTKVEHHQSLLHKNLVNSKKMASLWRPIYWRIFWMALEAVEAAVLFFEAEEDSNRILIRTHTFMAFSPLASKKASWSVRSVTEKKKIQSGFQSGMSNKLFWFFEPFLLILIFARQNC